MQQPRGRDEARRTKSSAVVSVSVKRALNQLLHVLISVVLAAEVAGIMLFGTARAGLDVHAAGLVAITLLFLGIAWVTYRYVSQAPEKTSPEPELATALEHQDMRRIPRWWGTVPVAIAVLGAVLAWLVLRG